MNKPKFIEEHEELDYKKQLAAFMQEINPKPTLEILEQLKEKYRLARESQ